MAELLKDIQTYWDMRAGGFSDASMEERKTEPGKHWENIFQTLQCSQQLLQSVAL